jgi:mitogen-activated protein kinase kinase 4
MCQSMQTTGKLQLSTDVVYDFTSEDLQDLGEIGRGGFGTVNKMIHRLSNTVMAVKVRDGIFILYIPPDSILIAVEFVK